jgi:hypothetical protein
MIFTYRQRKALKILSFIKPGIKYVLAIQAGMMISPSTLSPLCHFFVVAIAF